MIYRRFQIGDIGWRGKVGIVVALALAFGLAIGFIILAFGIALLLLPVVAVASLIGWFRWRKLMAATAQRQSDAEQRGNRVIDIEYKVVDRHRDGDQPAR